MAREHPGELLHAWLLLPLIAVGMRTLGFRAVRQLLNRRHHPRRTAPGFNPSRLAQVVDIAANLSVIGRSCLARALVLEKMLLCRNVPAQLRVGVRRTGSGIGAHAWVEVEGVPVGERADVAQTFQPFERVGPRVG